MRSPLFAFAHRALRVSIARVLVVLLIVPLGVSQAAATDDWRLLTTLPVGSRPGAVAYDLEVQGAIARGPQAITADAGHIYVLDSVNRRIHTLSLAGTFLGTIDLPFTTYPREITAARGQLFVLDTTARVYELGRDGGLVGEHALPDGMDSSAILKLDSSVDGQPHLWTRGYYDLLLDVLPLSLNVDGWEKGNNSGRGLRSGNGKSWLPEPAAPLAGVMATTDNAARVQLPAVSFFGDARPLGFDAAAHLYMLVEDLGSSSRIDVEQSVRRIDANGTSAAARIPFERFVMNPHRSIEVLPSGDLIAMVPAAAAVEIYRVRTGPTYRSRLQRNDPSQRQAAPRELPLLAAANSDSAAYAQQPAAWATVDRKNAILRAKQMVNTTWTWHNSYDWFNSYDVVPAADVARPTGTAPRPVQLGGASEGSAQTGIPYYWGGFDSPWSYSDWGGYGSRWSSWAGALSYYLNQSKKGPLVGDPDTSCVATWQNCWSSGTYRGGAGIDCAGFVYAASGDVANPKKGTGSLMSDAYSAGFGGNVQPGNYFASTNHTFFYEFRMLDASGIYTLESTTDSFAWPAYHGSKMLYRTWGDVAGYTHRSWWPFITGDTYTQPRLDTGYHAATYGTRGQNVFYRYTIPGGRVFQIDTISGGDPDLWLMDQNLNLIGSSTNGGSSTDAVYTPSAGTYYVMIHIWDSSGGNVNYNITYY
jgi:hypothetical protein